MTAPSGQNPSNTPLQPPGRFSVFRRVWRRVENGVFLFFFLLIVLYFLLQSPFVQNWLIGKATAFLSEELQTTVRLDKIDVGLFDNVILEGLYVEDLNKDTLLIARELRASLETNFFSILNNRLNFDEITLSGAQLRLKRPAGQAENNLQFILDYFAKPRAPNKPPAPFHLRVKTSGFLMSFFPIRTKYPANACVLRCPKEMSGFIALILEKIPPNWNRSR